MWQSTGGEAHEAAGAVVRGEHVAAVAAHADAQREARARVARHVHDERLAAQVQLVRGDARHHLQRERRRDALVGERKEEVRARLGRIPGGLRDVAVVRHGHV